MENIFFSFFLLFSFAGDTQTRTMTGSTGGRAAVISVNKLTVIKITESRPLLPESSSQLVGFDYKCVFHFYK